MIVPNISTEDLKKLPLRAIVALAARCARRVEYLSLLPDGHPDRDRCRTAIDGAIRLAEDFARGSPCPAVPIRDPGCRGLSGDRAGRVRARDGGRRGRVDGPRGRGGDGRPRPARRAGGSQPDGHATAEPFPQLANVAADLAARDAFTAAVDAAVAAGFGDEFIKGAMQDYQTLLKLGLGSYPEAGQPIDPSPAGPLGQL